MPNICDKFHFGWPEGVILGKCQMSFKHSSFTVNTRKKTDWYQSSFPVRKGSTDEKSTLWLTRVCLEAQWWGLPICRDHCPRWGLLRIPPLGFCSALDNRSKWHGSADRKHPKDFWLLMLWLSKGAPETSQRLAQWAMLAQGIA